MTSLPNHCFVPPGFEVEAVSGQRKHRTAGSADTDRLTIYGKTNPAGGDNDLNQEIASKCWKRWELLWRSPGRESCPGAFHGIPSRILRSDFYGYADAGDGWLHLNPENPGYRERRCQKHTDIAMTANAFADDRQKTAEAGMNEHLAKPINMEQLKRALDQWLKNSAVRFKTADE